MDEILTKEDLRQFGLVLLNDIRIVMKENKQTEGAISDPEWLKSKSVRKMLDISAGSVQNLRVSKKVRFKKVLGAYYYNREDLQKLFEDEK